MVNEITEHIKTGAEIYNIGKYKPEMMLKDGIHFAMSKWVSLSWLKEQKEDFKKTLCSMVSTCKTWDPSASEYCWLCKSIDKWFLSLLEEKQ